MEPGPSGLPGLIAPDGACEGKQSDNIDGGERARSVPDGATLFDPNAPKAPNGKDLITSAATSDTSGEIEENSVQAVRFKPLLEALGEAQKRTVLFKIEDSIQAFLRDPK